MKKKNLTKLLIIVITVTEETPGHFHFYTPLPLWHNSPWRVRASKLARLHDHTHKYHTWYDSSGKVISMIQRPRHNNTQHSQDADIYAPIGIGTHNPMPISIAVSQ